MSGCLSPSAPSRWPIFASSGLNQARAQGQDSQKKITLVVPFAAGGSLDTVARLIGQKISAVFGQPVVVENRVGAGGNLGARAVASADPDGHTLLYTSTGVAINQMLYANPGYAIADLTPVIFAAVNTTIFAVNPNNPAQNLTQFLANAKAKPFTFGTAGTGTGGHLTGEYFFRSVAKVEAIHTPFAGGAPAGTALMGNHIDAISTAVPDITSQVKAGTLRGIAVASAKRASALPDVPTVAEQGFPRLRRADLDRPVRPRQDQPRDSRKTQSGGERSAQRPGSEGEDRLDRIRHQSAIAGGSARVPRHRDGKMEDHRGRGRAQGELKSNLTAQALT